jgi:hypothetical protein
MAKKNLKKKAARGREVSAKAAAELLLELYPLAERDFREGLFIDVPKAAVEATERLFASKTQAYRDALPTCVLARIADPLIDIRLPATAYGENAFSGRSLSDKVVTPFLREKSIPVSAAPFLSAVRGGAKFMPGGEPRIQRDPEGFAALVSVVEYVRGLSEEDAKAYLRHLLRRFVQLREGADIALKRIAKPNLVQLERLIKGLLGIKSGGRYPSYLATAMFQTMGECHNLGWEIEFQGINVADKASGAVGDITVRKDGAIVLGVEVTERSIAKPRVTRTFDDKISPHALPDYLFISTATPAAEAVEAAQHYTAVGHEMNFAPLAPWLLHILSVLGPEGRTVFQDNVITLVRAKGVPGELKVAWNACMEKAIGLGPSS